MTARPIFPLVIILNIAMVGLAVIINMTTELNPFKEGSFITVFSALQLLAIARLSQLIFRARDAGRTTSIWKSSSVVWAIVAVGFVFLAADEVLKIHEKLDYLIHDIFSIEETGFTDRIDDILVGLYGVIGIAVLIVYRKELIACQARFALFGFGFVLLFIMVALDALTNRKDILLELFNQDLGLTLHTWLSMLEDSLKVFSEAFFILGFYAILQKVRVNKPSP